MRELGLILAGLAGIAACPLLPAPFHSMGFVASLLTLAWARIRIGERDAA